MVSTSGEKKKKDIRKEIFGEEKKTKRKDP